MNTKKTTFRADKLKFSNMNTSEAEFFTIEYADPDFAKALGIMGGKVYLLVDDLFKFSACLQVDDEPVMEIDKGTGAIVPTGEKKDSYYIEDVFTQEELNAIQLRIIQYFHYMLYDGEVTRGGKQYEN